MASGAVNVVEFAKARLVEMERVMAAAGETAEVRHLRRRTRSHKKPLAHGARRAKRTPLALEATRSPQGDPSHAKPWLLETHVWHAKRMEMGEIGGWMVPLRRSDRGGRAAARSLLTQCVLWDASHELVCVPGGWVALVDVRARDSVEGARDPDLNRFCARGPEAEAVARRAGVITAKPVKGGVDVIVPRGEGRRVWVALILAGGHAIGATERRLLMAIEGGEPTFEDLAAVPDGARLVRLVARDKGVPKEGDGIFVDDDTRVGEVTTAAFSRTLGRGAAIGHAALQEQQQGEKEGGEEVRVGRHLYLATTIPPPPEGHVGNSNKFIVARGDTDK